MFFGHPLFARLKPKTDWFTDIDASNLNIRDVLGCTPLHYAAWLRDEEIARLLLVRGAKPTSPDLAECTPLHYAAEKGVRAVARILLEHGADIEAQGRN
jgi:ankyrin repeat protein